MNMTTTPPAERRLRLGPAAAGRCRRRVHLDADPTADRSQRTPMDDGTRHRLSDMAAHRQLLLDRLAGVLSATTDWTPDRTDRPVAIIAPNLQSDVRLGSPDLLLWVEDGYVPVMIRNHRATDSGSGAMVSTLADPWSRAPSLERKPRSHVADQLGLAHHFRLLTELGLASSTSIGGVIGRGAGEPGAREGADDGEIILWHELAESGVLADYETRFADRYAVARAAMDDGPALAQPSRIGECRRCSWWPVCAATLTAAHDISLISAGGDVEVLHAAGLRTVDDLAAMPSAEVELLPLTGVVPRTARVRARAWLAGAQLVRKEANVGVRRADIELDVDMESYLDDGAYLWGTYLTGPGLSAIGVEPGYRPFASWLPLPDVDEGRAFADFWGFLRDLRERAAVNGLTFAAYCYSRLAEERWMRSAPLRFPEVCGMPELAEVAAFCDSVEWVDIYQEIRDQFVVPGSMKLKVLAPVAGFSWRDPEPGGENSMAWYRDAIGGGEQPGDPAMRERVLHYNEDDVLATLALRRWITDEAWQVPTIADLDRD